MSALKPRVFLKGLVLIATLVAIGYLYEVGHLDHLLDKRWIDDEVRGKGISGELLFLAVGALVTALAMPRQVVSFLGGYAFGFLIGALLSMLATVIGCLLTFSYARWFGRAWVQANLANRVRRIDEFARDNTFSMTLLIRLLPAGNNALTCLAAGVSRVHALPFVLGSALGYVPQTLVFALIGSGIALDPLVRIGLGSLLFVASGALGIYLFRRFRQKGRHFDPELERSMGLDD